MYSKKSQTGFSLVELLMVIAIIGILAAIAIPGLLAARKSSNHVAAQQNLRTLGQAEQTYRSLHNRFTDLAGLSGAKMVDGEWAAGVHRNGYVYADTPEVDQEFYFAADPESATTGEEFYGIEEDCVIRRGAATLPEGGGTPIGT